MIEYSDFAKVEMLVGTVITARPNLKARKPAYILTIDFGSFGTKTSSAQITEHYSTDELVGRQIVAVVNFLPKRIAGVSSEVLVLASTGETGVVLLSPTKKVANGSRVA